MPLVANGRHTMADTLEQQAFNDLDEIASDARRALNKLDTGDVDSVEDLLEDIHDRAESWSDP